jgi:hypothetical protein
LRRWASFRPAARSSSFEFETAARRRPLLLHSLGTVGGVIADWVVGRLDDVAYGDFFGTDAPCLLGKAASSFHTACAPAAQLPVSRHCGAREAAQRFAAYVSCDASIGGWERRRSRKTGKASRGKPEKLFLAVARERLPGARFIERRASWITFPAARFLESLVSRESRVFEYGAGGSTRFFAGRVGELVTVEHDREWLQRTAAKMSRRSKRRWQAHLAEPVASEEPGRFAVTDPQTYASTDPRFAGMSFRAYASVIERYDDNYFDVVLIDGRARPSCFKHAVAKVKFGGYIVFDNAEREQYRWVEEAARKLSLELLDFWGPGPYNRYFWRTIFLRKVRDRFALDNLDVKLERYLDFDGGTFVEAGANDGVAQSNTLYFEWRRGWRGLLIEPCRSSRKTAGATVRRLWSSKWRWLPPTVKRPDRAALCESHVHGEGSDAHDGRGGCAYRGRMRSAEDPELRAIRAQLDAEQLARKARPAPRRSPVARR